jgi:hypothetical protein
MPDTHAITLSAVQMETVRRALADAIELQTEIADGHCNDCDLDGAGLCDQHAAGLTWRAEYQDLAAQLEPEPDRGPQWQPRYVPAPEAGIGQAEVAECTAPGDLGLDEAEADDGLTAAEAAEAGAWRAEPEAEL